MGWPGSRNVQANKDNGPAVYGRGWYPCAPWWCSSRCNGFTTVMDSRRGWIDGRRSCNTVYRIRPVGSNIWRKARMNKELLLAYYGDAFTGSTDVLEVL